MTYTRVAIQDFLASLSPFSQLSEAELSDLAAKLQPWRYRMGQKILERENLPSQVVFIYEGQARSLGYDPNTRLPVTLGLLRPGSMIGWAGLVRDRACETGIASTESTCLAISASDFQALVDRHEVIRNYFYYTASEAEVYELLGIALQNQAQGTTDLKRLTLDVMADVRVHYLYPGPVNLNDPAHDELQARDRVWLVSSGELANCPIGNCLRFAESSMQLEVLGTKPVRLLGIRAGLLHQTTHTEAVVGISSAPIAATTQAPATVDRIPDTVPAALTIPYAPETRVYSPDPDALDHDDRPTGYPFVQAKGGRESSLACFQMLSQFLRLPFRREAIRRVLEQHTKETGAPALQTCGSIADLMGLNAQLVSLPATAVSRLEPPALIVWQDELAVLYEASDRRIVLGVPSQGLLRMSVPDFTANWGQAGKFLLIQPTKETPQQRFGISWFWPVLSKYRRVLIEVLIASFFVQLFGLANPLMIQVIIDKVLVQNSPDTLHILGVLLLVVAVFEGVLGSLRTYLFAETINRIDMTLGSEIIDHLLRLPLRYFERRPVGELATRVNELENIRQFLTGTALNVVLDAIFSVLYIVVMFVYSWLLTLVALATIPLFAAVTLLASPVIRRQLRTKAERNAQTQSHLVEVLSGIQTVKAQNIELRSRWKWQEHYARYVSAGFKTVVTSTAANSTSHFLSQLSGLLVLWVGAYLVLEQELTLGQLIAFRIIAGYVTSPLLRLVQLWQNFQQTALSLERLSDIVDSPREAGDDDRHNIPMPPIRGEVVYDNVSFRFGPSGPMQLNNVNLRVPAGAFVGIVGQSGSGKSTLMKLLGRLYEPTSGRILIDDYDINKVQLYSLRSQVGLVPQDPLLFDGTVQENIALTAADAATEDIVGAAQLAVAHEFIMNLPNGYNTRVGEKGSNLSGGQRQRVAIARTILQNPNLVILDEATSALDYDTERRVCDNITRAFRGRTIFFITHRLSTVQNADIIVLMDQGSIAEQGTHAELMALKGRYYCLYQQQQAQMV